MRHRIEHNTVVISVRYIPRFKALGVIASMQPNITGPPGPTSNRDWGRRGRSGLTCGEACWINGAMLCWGTDWPVSQIDPMINLNKLVTRNPQQRLTMSGSHQILHGLVPLTLLFEENLKGTLEPGKLADIVVRYFERPVCDQPGRSPDHEGGLLKFWAAKSSFKPGI